jgi:hypothetical protein
MVGDAPFSPSSAAVPAISEVKKQRVLEVIADNGGKIGRAAVVLGVSASSLKRWVTAWNEPNTVSSRQSSTNPTRRFYESIRNPWSIISFDPKKREVCLEIRTPACTTNLSHTIPSWKFAD